VKNFALLTLLIAVTAGCGSTGEISAPDPDTIFGHRFDHRDADDRYVVDLVPPLPTEEYFTYDPVLTGLSIRVGPPLADGRRAVDLVVLGAFPDACTHLHTVEESRLVRQIHVTLDMWRPKGGVCMQVVRPYRFYYELREPLEPGSYTLHFNGSANPFQVFPPEEGER
jgi:hypothetical protein